jgi:hypothetical protein
MKIWEFIETLIPKVGAYLGVWGFIPSHSPTHGCMKCDFQTSILVRTLASSCLDSEPKTRVATIKITHILVFHIQIQHIESQYHFI